MKTAKKIGWVKCCLLSIVGMIFFMDAAMADSQSSAQPAATPTPNNCGSNPDTWNECDPIPPGMLAQPGDNRDNKN